MSKEFNNCVNGEDSRFSGADKSVDEAWPMSSCSAEDSYNLNIVPTQVDPCAVIKWTDATP
jgi:hypothetical protein